MKYELINTSSQIKKFKKSIGSVFAFDVENDAGLERFNPLLTHISFSNRKYTGVIPVNANGCTCVPIDEAMGITQEVFDGAERIIGHNLKYDWHVVKSLGVDFKCKYFDTMVAAFCINENDTINLKDLAFRYFNVKRIDFKDLLKKYKCKLISEVPYKKSCLYSAFDAYDTIKLYPIFKKELIAQGLTYYFYNVEMPLIKVLMAMERRGTLVDRDFLLGLQENADSMIETQQKKIFHKLGKVINLRSPQQLGEALFEDLGIDKKLANVTPTGRISTDEGTLTKIKNAGHKIGGYLLDYRTLNTVRTRYIGDEDGKGLLSDLYDDNTIHTSYNTTITVTGRLSSDGPNLQNVITSDEDSKILKYFPIRQAFIVPVGWDLVIADYKQIELKLLAAFAEEQKMLDAFRKGIDIHAVTASEIFEVPIDEVTDAQRKVGKTCNFAVVYGTTEYGLAYNLGIPIRESKRYLGAWFATYPNIPKLRRKIVSKAIKNNPEEPYIYSFWRMGSKRRIKELLLPKKEIRHFTWGSKLLPNKKYMHAENQIFNFAIQGSAAVLMKLAMIQCDDEIPENKLLLQVHDEQASRCKKKHTKDVIKKERKIMMNPYDVLTKDMVPIDLTVDIKSCKTWNEK